MGPSFNRAGRAMIRYVWLRARIRVHSVPWARRRVRLKLCPRAQRDGSGNGTPKPCHLQWGSDLEEAGRNMQRRGGQQGWSARAQHRIPSLRPVGTRILSCARLDNNSCPPLRRKFCPLPQADAQVDHRSNLSKPPGRRAGRSSVQVCRSRWNLAETEPNMADIAPTPTITCPLRTQICRI